MPSATLGSGLAWSEENDYEFVAEDGPSIPGSPYAPPHPPLRRLAYLAIGLWIGVTSALANATVNVNLANLAGEQQLYLAEASWLPAVYVAFNACANLLLIKCRAQFGVATVMRPLFLVYALVTASQFWLPGFTSALVVRAISGVVAAGMTTLGLYYLMQTVSRQNRPIALVVGLGVTQLGSPIARMIPVDLLSTGGWRGQFGVELALVCMSLFLTTLLPLPRSDRIRQIEPLDFVTVSMFLPAMVLLCGVMNRGRLAWWMDTAWLGYALIAAIPLFVGALLVERLRARPLLDLRWLSSYTILRFAGIALLMRLALAEQTYGSVGLLTSSGLDDDQLRMLFACVALAMVAGVGCAAVSISEKAIPYLVIVAALCIASGAWLDSHASSITRPEQLFLSQSLIGFGTCLFIGPTLAHGVIQVLRTGPTVFVTVVVVFSISQNVGGLAGAALLGTYQSAAQRSHAAVLAERIPYGDAQVSSRLDGVGNSLRAQLPDAVARGRLASTNVSSIVNREAGVLAFDDVFRLVAWLAAATAVFVGANLLLSTFLKMKRELAA